MSPQEQKKEIKKNASTLRKGLKVGGIIAAVGTVAALGAWAGYAYYKTTVTAAKRDKTLFLCVSKDEAGNFSARRAPRAHLRLVDFTKFVEMMNANVAPNDQESDTKHLKRWNAMSSRDEVERLKSQCVAARFWEQPAGAGVSPVKISDLVATTEKSGGAFSSFKFQVSNLNLAAGGFTETSQPFDAGSVEDCAVKDPTLRGCADAEISAAMVEHLPPGEQNTFQNNYKVWREDYDSFVSHQSTLAKMLTVVKVTDKPAEEKLLGDDAWLDTVVAAPAWTSAAVAPAQAPDKAAILTNFASNGDWRDYFGQSLKGWKPVDDTGKIGRETQQWLDATENGDLGSATPLVANSAAALGAHPFTNKQMKVLCDAYNKRLADKKAKHVTDMAGWKSLNDVKLYESVVKLMEGIWRKLAIKSMPATPAAGP
jgi:hypothetical protein